MSGHPGSSSVGGIWWARGAVPVEVVMDPERDPDNPGDRAPEQCAEGQHHAQCAWCADPAICSLDEDDDPICRECWETKYPSSEWGCLPEEEDYSEEETVVGTVAAQCARAARLKREAEDRANFEEKERD